MTPPSTEPPAGEGAAAQQTSGIEATGFRWGQDDTRVPDYLRGRSADETLDIVSKMEAAIRYAATAHNVTAAQPTVVTMPEPTVQIDDDLLVTNPAEWRRRFAADQDQRMNATLAQVAQPVFNNMAATAAELARRDDGNKDVAEKWWNEVEQVVAPKTPRKRRTVRTDGQDALRASERVPMSTWG